MNLNEAKKVLKDAGYIVINERISPLAIIKIYNDLAAKIKTIDGVEHCTQGQCKTSAQSTDFKSCLQVEMSNGTVFKIHYDGEDLEQPWAISDGFAPQYVNEEQLLSIIKRGEL